MTTNEIILSRLWIPSKLNLGRRDIVEIIKVCLIGKTMCYQILTKIDAYNIPRDVPYSDIRSFAIKNEIKLSMEEGFHGGGRTTLYSFLKNQETDEN